MFGGVWMLAGGDGFFCPGVNKSSLPGHAPPGTDAYHGQSNWRTSGRSGRHRPVVPARCHRSSKTTGRADRTLDQAVRGSRRSPQNVVPGRAPSSVVGQLSRPTRRPGPDVEQRKRSGFKPKPGPHLQVVAPGKWYAQVRTGPGHQGGDPGSGEPELSPPPAVGPGTLPREPTGIKFLVCGGRPPGPPPPTPWASLPRPPCFFARDDAPATPITSGAAGIRIDAESFAGPRALGRA